MNEERVRLPLPRNGLKVANAKDDTSPKSPAVVTPDYGDAGLGSSPSLLRSTPAPVAQSPRTAKKSLDPFEAYGERTASRPFALRLPEPIDLAIRQIAAERHTQPLRIVDQALHDYLVKLGRLPSTTDA